MRKNIVCGAFKSDMSKVPVYKEPSFSLPEKYELPCQDEIYDQGNLGICVSVSMKEALDFKNFQANRKMDIPLDLFYNEREDKSLDGMTVKEAMEIAHSKKMVDTYCKIQDVDGLKSSILTNGPAIVCMPVRDLDNREFWKGSELIGGHALVAIGWDDEGITLKNSWGKSYGIQGTSTLYYDDWSYIMELWTII